MVRGDVVADDKVVLAHSRLCFQPWREVRVRFHPPTRAQGVLQEAICSESQLGKADIVLSRVSSAALTSDKKNKVALLRQEEKWRQGLPTKCHVSHLPVPDSSLNCLRKAFEDRFTEYESCMEGSEGRTCLAL